MENQIPMAMATEIERGTKTQEDQWRVESQVFQIYNLFQGIPPNSQFAILELQRDKHIEYLTKGFKQLGRSFTVLDANRPWLCYWMLHSIALLRDCVDDKLENDCIDFLSRCQDPKGGYGGGPGQMPHLATTYAAVNSLITLGGHRSLSSINRRTFYDFLLRMKERSGGFRMHDGGEVDVRACYTAISAASVLNILDDELTQNVGDYIVSCQTYEGGIAGEPGSEAHGGYTFCGLAAMILINEVHRLDLPALINWVVFRQGIECGFQGRTNKLVDGCYSFWQGGVAALIQRLQLIVNDQMGLSNILECDCSTDSDYDSINSDISADEQSLEGTSSHVNEMCQIREEAAGQPNTSHLADVNNVGYNFIKGHVHMKPLFNNMALQQYILLCSQEEGGFRDKPGKSRDHYHTCYCLSGLSVSQYSCTKDVGSPPLPQDVLGPYSNLLERVHPLYNVVLDRYYEANEFFKANSL
ncbi:protein farnesyltransferase subunit beta isoform X2 [Olea europaea var. sylvestris]|uniref:protein farnesyltransferase subunit beta isoform X2 n=1 Tax=Olea europaea var. sylvestris TaxID=158386 RepID=UPI000C1D6895|nr:protein farnesyltransferase subunit beta isoform X2 [Olea europaea var. sylvestris]